MHATHKSKSVCGHKHSYDTMSFRHNATTISILDSSSGFLLIESQHPSFRDREERLVLKKKRDVQALYPHPLLHATKIATAPRRASTICLRLERLSVIVASPAFLCFQGVFRHHRKSDDFLDIDVRGGVFGFRFWSAPHSVMGL